MKNLKTFEKYLQPFERSEIHEFCKKYRIEEYSIDSYGVINVNRSVDIGNITSGGKTNHDFDLETIPFKFGKIDGNFGCYNLGLKTLKNSPDYISGTFDCSENKLTTLLEGPKYVGSEYHCYGNDLKDAYGLSKFFSYLFIEDNPIYEIIKIVEGIEPNFDHDDNTDYNEWKLERIKKFVILLNEYQAIRNGNTIIQDRLEEALYGVREYNLESEYSLGNKEFKNYRIV